MSLVDKILRELNNSPKLRYKRIRVNIFGLPDFKFYSQKAISNSFSHLKSNGYLEIEEDNIKITKRGLTYLKSKRTMLKCFKSSFAKSSPKNLIVMYDIPYYKKKERDWFRRQLTEFGYIMIQKSVWVGPSPLPREFLDYVKLVGIKDQLKTFKLAKSYVSSNYAMA